MKCLRYWRSFTCYAYRRLQHWHRKWPTKHLLIQVASRPVFYGWICKRRPLRRESIQALGKGAAPRQVRQHLNSAEAQPALLRSTDSYLVRGPPLPGLKGAQLATASRSRA